jgi:4-diphosphocytidyl-2-C-methyl-D-erythritol kinase
MIDQRSLTVRTPAKLNLGLEILGRRADGYHEIRTVMATIGLFDTLRITAAREAGVSSVTGVPSVEPVDNLITKAIDVFAEATGEDLAVDVSVKKAIPSPGGIGGASSDAAATLLALDAMTGTALPKDDLLDMAARIGSDVPFFLEGCVALATGTGTTLTPLAAFHAYAVLVVPALDIPAKTASLYGSLNTEDFSQGSQIDGVLTALETGLLPRGEHLRNAFVRPLYLLAPELTGLHSTLMNCGAPYVALSGAGPAHYVLFETGNDAHSLAHRVEREVNPGTLVTVVDVGGSSIVIDDTRA